MRIGVIIGRIGDIDGVSLETEKWIHVLQEMGHEIFIVSGRYTAHPVDRHHETLITTLSFFSPECEWEQKRAFFYPDEDPEELLNHLYHTSEVIAIQLFKWVIRNKIEVLLVENASALPCHLSMGMGIKQLVEHTGMWTVCHDHDFYWERGERYATPHKEVEDIVNATFPLQIPSVRHAVINSEAKDTLRHRFNIDSSVVPNVMDFNQGYAQEDDYNADMLESIGISNGDITLFQVTRIVERKGIETAIELVEKMEDKRVKLVITGSKADDERFGYFKYLVDLIDEKGLTDRVSFGYRRILPQRGETLRGGKIYSIPDAYAKARGCTYFSLYEGFGNAFVECVLAKRPIFVNNYKPVYWPEIGSKGFETVMLEDNELTPKAVEEIESIIHDDKRSREIAEHNYALGKKYFSYEVLEEILQELFRY
jgi:glycosyltransferase involved in cell wall biosynthesis